MRTTTKIFLSVSVLFIGYFGTMAVNFILAKTTEGRLISTADSKLPAALIGQTVVVSFDRLFKQYEDAVILGDEETLEAAKQSGVVTLKHLKDLSRLSGLNRNTMIRISKSLNELKQLIPRANSVFGKLALGSEDPNIQSQSSELNRELLTLRKKFVALSDTLKSDVKTELSAIVDRSKTSRYLSILVFIAVILASVIILSAVVVRFISKPLNHVLIRVRDIAEGEGDLTRRLEVTSRDELGELSGWFNTFLQKLQNVIASVGATTQTLGHSSEALTHTAHDMTDRAMQTSAQVSRVSASASQVSENAQMAAAGVEEMGASIREIAKNANRAADVATSAVKVAQRTNTTVEKLGSSSAAIGKIIQVITSIAEQTNLLALNATIEAARAGDSGKGFAVVANEVKELAAETSKATDEISNRIQAIQGDAQEAMKAIGEIGNIIKDINSLQTSIAGAVQEQDATMTEIGRSVNLAASGSTDIAQDIVIVAEAADGTTSGAANTQESAQELARMSMELSELIGQFKYQ